jgi:hypothetical protein
VGQNARGKTYSKALLGDKFERTADSDGTSREAAIGTACHGATKNNQPLSAATLELALVVQREPTVFAGD